MTFRQLCDRIDYYTTMMHHGETHGDKAKVDLAVAFLRHYREAKWRPCHEVAGFEVRS